MQNNYEVNIIVGRQIISQTIQLGYIFYQFKRTYLTRVMIRHLTDLIFQNKTI